MSGLCRTFLPLSAMGSLCSQAGPYSCDRWHRHIFYAIITSSRNRTLFSWLLCSLGLHRPYSAYPQRCLPILMLFGNVTFYNNMTKCLFPHQEMGSLSPLLETGQVVLFFGPTECASFGPSSQGSWKLLLLFISLQSI